MSKFKVGDRVICTDKLYHLNKSEEGGGAGWRKNKCFVIEYISEWEGVVVYWDTEYRKGVYENYLILANDTGWDNEKN